MPKTAKPGIYTIHAVFGSGPLAGDLEFTGTADVSTTAVPAGDTRLVGMKLPEIDPQQWIVGSSADLPSATGKVTLISFWSTPCVPCIAEFPDLEQAYRRMKNAGGAVLALAPSTDDVAKCRAIATSHNLAFPIALDSPPDYSGLGETFSVFSVTNLPRHVVVDRKGSVRYCGASLQDALRVMAHELKEGN